MLEPLLSTINSTKKIVLASSSARRKEILASVGLKFDVIPSEFDEGGLIPENYSNNVNYVLDLAKHKVNDVIRRLKLSKNIQPDITIGADTIVVLNEHILGKPKDERQAIEYLTMLSGNRHVVLTAVVIASPARCIEFVESTNVQIAYLTNEVIQAYVRTGDPMDKAGSYGIQGIGGSFVERIEGDFYNVMGLPLHRFCVSLIKILEDSA